MNRELNLVGKRKTASLRSDHHRILRTRRDQTGVKIEALLDEALELGMRMKRWLPDPAEETATA